MCFTNDDFLDDLDFGGPQSFDINRKDRPEEFNAEESEKNQIILQYPPVEKPLLFFSDLKKNTVTKKLTDVKKGTTTLAFVYKSGILIAVDSRASMGSYIASKTVRKVTEINSYLLGTIAGGASDCQFWERQLSFWCKLYELRHGTRVPVTAASEVLCDWVAQYRGRGLSMGTMICGYDGDEQKIFLVEDDGTRLQGNLFSVGSGSTHAYGVLDSKWKYDMIGYGFVKRRESCSATTGIPGEVLVRTGRTNVLEAMQGLVPGLTVSNGRAIIRGIATINSVTDPLYIVDGVEVQSLSFVSVYDVDRVEVLKDANIYGAKGANGAILVTTKRGAKK